MEFQLSISPSNEYSGLISFRIDWFDLLAVQGIFKSLLQHHSSKASILRHSASFRFLPYINMNQPCPPPLEHPSHLSPPIPSHPSRLSQNMGLSSLSHTAHSHWKSILYMVIYVFPCNSVHHLQLLKKKIIFIFGCASVIMAHGLSCSVECRIFPDQVSNSGALHWQADSQPLDTKEVPSATLILPDI